MNKVKVEHAGGMFPLTAWESGHLQVVWHVRWTSRGLMCVRPEIRTAHRIDLPPQKCFNLTAKMTEAVKQGER